MNITVNAIKNILKECKEINIWRTLKINIKNVGWKTALHFPILVYKGCYVTGLSRNSIKLNCPIHPGILRIGKLLTKLSDNHTIISFTGRANLTLNGSCLIGRGSRFFLDNCNLTIGDNFSCSANMKIIGTQSITIGNDCMFSWDITIMDTDYHPITDVNGDIINPSASINIGNHVWIGCNTIICKNVKITDNCIISAGSVIRGVCQTPGCIYGNINGKTSVIRQNVNWSRELLVNFKS